MIPAQSNNRDNLLHHFSQFL